MNYSIIVPHYNIPDLLERCLNSIPRRDDLEVIVIDDNSTKAPIDFAKYPGLKRNDVNYIYNKENSGAGVSRNIGIEKAVGKWLLFVDADDFLKKDALSIIDCSVDTLYDVIIFKADHCLSEDITKKGTRRHADDLNYLIDKCVNGQLDAIEILFLVMSPWCKLVKRDFINDNNIRFDTVKVSEDVLFSTKLAVGTRKCKVVDKIVYCITEREGSLSDKNSIEKILIDYDVLKRKNEYLEAHGISQYKEYIQYVDLKYLASVNKKIYVSIVLNALKEGLLKPMRLYRIEHVLHLRYPYIFLILHLLDLFPKRNFPFVH